MVIKKLNRSNRKCRSEIFIKKALEFHKNKYDYSLADYINNHTKIKIICPVHGVFEQTPNNHLNYGCKFCGGTYKFTTKNFIEKSKIIHKDNYVYDNSIYIDNKTEVLIHCRKHGDFLQVAKNHISGSGCPECGKFKRLGRYNITVAERHKEEYNNIKAFVYLIKIKSNEDLLKIGITKNIKTRFKKINKKIEILYTFETNLYDAIFIEHSIINKLKNDLFSDFKFKGYTECFRIENLEKINKEFRNLWEK